MRVLRALGFLLCTLFFAAPPLLAQATAPTAAKRDAQAIAILQQSLAAMGGVPNDVQASGSVTITAGSKTDVGTIRVVARGVDQTREEIGTADGLKAEVFSGRRGASKVGDTQTEKSLEWASSAQSTVFPAMLISAAVANPDSAFEYLGLEDVAGTQAHHLRFSNTYASNAELQVLMAFSTKDIWVGATSSLPVKLSYERREGSGPVPRIRVEVTYGDYRNASGFLFPFAIERAVNGVPRESIRIQSVQVNLGPADAEFKIR
jgi:hypothetical protein